MPCSPLASGPSASQGALPWNGAYAARVFAACKGPTPTDDSLLTRQPCALPCWQGLTPGQSRLEEVLDVLDQNPLVAGNWREGMKSTAGFSLYWRWAGEPRDVGRSNDFQFDAGGVLQSISVHPNQGVRLGRLVHEYGSPTFVGFAVRQRHAFAFGPPGVNATAIWTGYALEVTWFESTEIPPLPMLYCPSVDRPIDEVTNLREEAAQSVADAYEIQQWSPRSGGVFVAPGATVFAQTDDGVTSNCVEIPR